MWFLWKLFHSIRTSKDTHKDSPWRTKKLQISEKTFTESGSLKTHIKTIHAEQKNYKCDSCGKSFTQLINLKEHIKTIHEGQRNYKCDSCGKCFTQLGSLKRHIRMVHEGQKNHECEFCEKPFPTSGSLKLHIKQFLMVERIKIVTVVVNHFFLRDNWQITSNSSWSANNVIISYCRKYIHF